MADKLPDTPLLDDLEKGPWPSFVTEIKMAAAESPMSMDLLRLLERSYKEKIGHWIMAVLSVFWDTAVA